MLVLPLPVTPWRSLVGVETVSRLFRACFWAGFKGISRKSPEIVFPAFLITDSLRTLRFLPRPLGRKSLAARGRGVR